MQLSKLANIDGIFAINASLLKINDWVVSIFVGLGGSSFILRPRPPLSTLVAHNLQQIRAHPALHPHQIPVAATDRVDKSEFSTIGQMLI